MGKTLSVRGGCGFFLRQAQNESAGHLPPSPAYVGWYDDVLSSLALIPKVRNEGKGFGGISLVGANLFFQPFGIKRRTSRTWLHIAVMEIVPRPNEVIEQRDGGRGENDTSSLSFQQRDTHPGMTHAQNLDIMISRLAITE